MTCCYSTLLIKYTDKLEKRCKKCCFIKSQHLLYVENTKSSYKNNKFKLSAITQQDNFEVPNASYSVSQMQDYFECIIKKHDASLTNNPEYITAK